MRMKPLQWLALVFLIIGISTNVSASIRVVTTLPDLAAIAIEVGGEHVDARALASPSQDPHYVDARPNYILELNQADLLILNGVELEVGWLPQLQNQARNSDIIVGGRGYLDVSTHVPMLEVPTMRIDRSMGDIHPGGNPHFTWSAVSAIAIAGAVRDKLSELDPENANAYSEQAAAFIARLEAFAIEQNARFAELSSAQRQIVVYHRSFPYLIDWLGLEEVAAIEPQPGIPPNPGHVARVLSTMRSSGTHVILQEEFYPTNTSETLSQLANARLVVIEGGTRLDDEDYVSHLQEIADMLYEAMAAAPSGGD